MSPVSDDSATVPCPVCGFPFGPSGRGRYCSTRCRQAAFRHNMAALRMPVVIKADTVYLCPVCEERYLGEQYCSDCGTFCRRLGPDGACPCCDEAISMTELLSPDQFLTPLEPERPKPSLLATKVMPGTIAEVQQLCRARDYADKLSS